MDTYYAVFVDEGKGERMIWMTPETTKFGRQFFYGGSGITPCISFHPNSARALIKKARKEFQEGAQFYVRKIGLVMVK